MIKDSLVLEFRDFNRKTGKSREACPQKIEVFFLRINYIFRITDPLPRKKI